MGPHHWDILQCLFSFLFFYEMPSVSSSAEIQNRCWTVVYSISKYIVYINKSVNALHSKIKNKYSHNILIVVWNFRWPYSHSANVAEATFHHKLFLPITLCALTPPTGNHTHLRVSSGLLPLSSSMHTFVTLTVKTVEMSPLKTHSTEPLPASWIQIRVNTSTVFQHHYCGVGAWIFLGSKGVDEDWKYTFYSFFLLVQSIMHHFFYDIQCNFRHWYTVNPFFFYLCQNSKKLEHFYSNSLGKQRVTIFFSILHSVKFNTKTLFTVIAAGSCWLDWV